MFSIVKNGFTAQKQESEGCCTPQPKGKVECPLCKENAKGVLAKTFDALVRDETKSKYSCFEGFYYCKTPSCEVVYFREETLLKQEDITVVVGLKNGAKPATLCYCFEWSREKIKKELQERGSTKALSDIKTKMQNSGCSCETLNPSGGCCLGDVGAAIKEIKKELGLS